jgi:hypothetical protein
LSENPNITFKIIQRFSDYPWDWEGLSINPNITFEIMQRFPYKPWDWSILSYNPNITLEIVQQNPDFVWDWRQLSNNMFNFSKKQKAKKCKLLYMKFKSIQMFKEIFNEVTYRPGNQGYYKALNSFNSKVQIK